MNLAGRAVAAAGFLASAVVGFLYQSELGGAEFSGGTVTGPLLNLHGAGFLLYLMAVTLVFVRVRIALGIALAASLLCFPLYLLFLTPQLFRRVFTGLWKTSPEPFRWDEWTVGAALGMALMAIPVIVLLIRRRGYIS